MSSDDVRAPGVSAQLRDGAGRRGGPAVALVVTVVALLACSGMLGGDPLPEDLAAAQQQLSDGMLPEATAAYRELHEDHPGSPEAAIGYAYTLALQERYAEADAALASVASSPDVLLRRALLARRQGLYDAVRELGLASDTPAGRVLAAEVMIIDLDLTAAIETLSAVGGDGPEASTAAGYLELLQHSDPVYRSLASPIALWSLGERKDACEGADRFLAKLPPGDDRNRRLLLWAGRAATSGMPRVARSMLDELGGAPDAQGWRERATRALVAMAEGDSDQALAILEGLRQARSGVPDDGLEDALVTACSLTRDPAVAQRLVRGVNTPAAARCLRDAGAVEAARTRQSGPVLGRMLENL